MGSCTNNETKYQIEFGIQPTTNTIVVMAATLVTFFSLLIAFIFSALAEAANQSEVLIPRNTSTYANVISVIEAKAARSEAMY